MLHQSWLQPLSYQYIRISGARSYILSITSLPKLVQTKSCVKGETGSRISPEHMKLF